MVTGTTALWVVGPFEKILALPAASPSTSSETPIIELLVCVQTEPASVSTAGPSLSMSAVALIGSGPAWPMITCTSAICTSVEIEPPGDRIWTKSPHGLGGRCRCPQETGDADH